ncbi:MAG: poly(3-hydroxyalkanoate) depolymerase [Pseudomonadales bacterium]|nr:poly(3-hydroxyalkanoate) depolymerase [Pseudomonadales bacterium]
MPLHFQYLDIDGHRLRVAERNRHARHTGTLLIFNGVGSAIEVLTPFLKALDSHHILTFDVPGVGGSSTPMLPRRLRHYAATAAGVLEDLDIERCSVMGISWGGVLAQQFALQFPHRLDRLILAATSPGQIMVPPGPLTLLRMATPLRYLSSAYFEQIVGSIYGGDFRDRSNTIAREHARRMVPPSLLGYFQQTSALWGWSSLHRLHRLKVPTLIMAGADDPIIPLINARIMAFLIPDARLEIFDCGHLFLLTRLERSVRLVEEFLATAST